MQANQATIGNVTITDTRGQNSQPSVETTKPEKKSRTAEQEALWKGIADKAHKRMFPNAKEGEKETAKPAAKEPAKEPKEKPVEPAKEPAKEPADNGDGKQTTEKPKEEPKPEPKVAAKKEESTPPVDIEKLARSVAKETAEAIKKTEPKPEDDVPETRRRDLAAVDYLDANNPKYKGAGAKYRKFAKDEAAYIAKWEASHAGESFDPDSDDHSAWYDKHDPEIDVDDLSDARIEIAADRRAKAIAEKESASAKAEIESLRRGIQIKDAEVHVPAYIARGVSVIAGSLGEDIAKKFSELKGDETLESHDPAAHQVIVETLPELQRQSVAAAHIFGTDGKAYDPKNDDHKAVAQAATAFQHEIQSWPEEKRTANGRTFATLDEWLSLTPEQQAKRWTINAELMSAYLSREAGKKASQIYKNRRDEVEKLAKAYGFTKNGEAQTAQIKPIEETQEQPANREKTRSPSTSTATVIQPGTKVSPKTSKDGVDSMLDKMFRR